jgi:error-prone DNA polymerase
VSDPEDFRGARPAPLRAPESGQAYVELAAATAFSFLRGASHPCEMVGQAFELGHAAAAVADRNTLAGVVRAHSAALRPWEPLGLKEGSVAPFRLCVGARLSFSDGAPDVLAYPSDREAFSRLTRLLTRGGMEAGARKDAAVLRLGDLLDFATGQNLILLPPDRPDAQTLRPVLDRLLAATDGATWLAGVRRFDAVDEMRLDGMAALAAASGSRLIAVNDALYHHPSRRRLHDVMTCIREHKTLFEAGRRLEPNAERHLKTPTEMARLFRDHPDAVSETVRFAAACDFSLDELRYEYPSEPVPAGKSADQHLADLCRTGAVERYGASPSPAVSAQLEEELSFIARMGYAHYFLTVHDVVAWARSQNILCQGRGSAANSVVCYCLGVTAIDPIEHKLLFSRFISENRKEPPDIDVDFEHERREEVIQYIYGRYGRHRAAICATVIHYRPRMAIREVGKVFGLTEDVTAALSGTVWGSWGEALPDEHVRQTGLDPDEPHLREVLTLANSLIGFPRHLSQHVGGFVLTERALSETCPIVNGAMLGRTFIEWDKDDIDALGIMKVDILALGMLTAIAKAFVMLKALGAFPPHADMASLPNDQPDVFQMCAAADTIGVFQIESRAQMNMLPRLKPRRFYDLVIEVAIVRPGPIQGDMVHPYLRRKAGLEPVAYPRPGPGFPQRELEEVLEKTLGVPLFQEQVMKVAMVAAQFTGAQADGLRRAMATFKRTGGVSGYQKELIEGMSARGYTPEFSQAIFRQIEGFGSYGFPESHAASFAKLVYVSAYLKCRFPAVFCAALLNSQPMGFYAPAQIVRDALEHGVEVRPVDVEHSAWDCTLETTQTGETAVRLGLRQIDGLSEAWAKVIPERRGEGYGDFETFIRRTGLTRSQVRRLAEADAFQSFAMGRRSALWQSLRVMRKTPAPLLDPLPRFTPPPPLPALSAAEEVVADYRATRLSLKGHPMAFLRGAFASEGVRPCAEVTDLADARPVCTAGVVLVRQRPGNGQVCFITLEDETGVANLVVVMDVFERYRVQIMSARLLLARGRVQKSPEGVTHVFVHHIEDRSAALAKLDDPSRLTPVLVPNPPREPDRVRVGHPRTVRIISRDFH